MFAVYASQANPDDPLAALAIGDLPEPEVPEGWLRIKISHASLNRHDIFHAPRDHSTPGGNLFPNDPWERRRWQA
jgi:NADPH:quinone reductase-like Zn-dependent oxidoreductase